MALDRMRLGKSFAYAWRGLTWSFAHNPNLQIHCAVALIVLLAAWFFQLGPYEVGIVGVAILFVLSAEMINTSIEEMTNLIVSEHRREAQIAKDVAAGMVLLATIGAVIIGLFVFVPHLLAF